MTKVVCIIQARLRSTRLPAKVLLPLPTGRTVLQEVIHRCKQIRGVDEVVCAIPDSSDCDILLPQIDVRVVRGPENDVLARYIKAAAETHADAVMRITADCPLLDPCVCADVLRLHRSGGYEYTSNIFPMREFPHGFDCEVFTVDVLDLAARSAKSEYDREHVTPWMQRHSSRKAVLKAMQDRSHMRWTLDTIDDYVTIWNLLANEAHPGRGSSELGPDTLRSAV